MDTAFRIRRLAPAEALEAAPALAAVLVDCIRGGAGVSFMADLTQDEAEGFWRDTAAAGDGRVFVAAEDVEGLCGVVMVIPAWPPNQPHRADISKLLVASRARRRGIAEALMAEAETVALEMRRPLLMLDTVEGSDAERLYRRLGWIAYGVVPDFALLPDGRPWGCTFFYKALAQ